MADPLESDLGAPMAEPTALSFAEAVARLESIVDQLERGDVPLEQSFELFEEGVRLARLCSAKLNDAEKKIETLSRNETGELNTSSAENLDGV